VTSRTRTRPNATAIAEHNALHLAKRASTADEIAAAIAACTAIPELDRTISIWSQLGELYNKDNRAAESMAAFRAASLIEPEHPSVLCNVTFGARHFDRESEAIGILRAALRRDPNIPEAWHNLGSMARNVGMLELSVACFEQAATGWDNPMSSVGYAEVLMQLGRAQEAFEFANRVLPTLDSDSRAGIELHMCRGLAGMLLQQLELAWEDHEYRLKRPEFVPLVPTDLPQWNGAVPGQDHVLLWREQGVGDEIRYLSCLPDLLATVDRVTIRCNPRLARVIARSFPVEVVTGVRDVPEGIDAHLPIASAMRAFRPNVASFPTTPSYLVPDPARVEQFRTALATLGSGMKVGVSWRSRVLTNRRNHNYPDFESLRALGSVDDIQLIDLQYDHDPEELARMESDLGVRVHHLPDLDLLNDIDGVLALCAALDGVVTVGNAVAELAGAVGTPTQQLALAHSSLEFGFRQSVWHPNSTFHIKDWADPWSPAIASAVQAARAAANRPN
jgi:tetratricopeptide (TPR) repeat protein